MKRLRALLVACGVLLPPAKALAVEWTHLGDLQDKTKVYVLMPSTWSSKERATMWQKLVSADGWFLMVLGEFSCKASFVRTLTASRFSPSGVIVQSDTESTDWSPIHPGSVAEVLRTLACDKGV